MRRNPRSGFSLLELSVVLVIIAVAVGFGLTGGRNAIEGSDRVTTQQRLNTIKKALDAYATLNGYLPCPARRDLIPSSSSFGAESRSGTSCTVAGDIKNVPASPSTPTIYIGAVPVRTLGLPDAYAADAWSNKFLYAVSMNHVGDNTSMLTRDGPIVIRYGNRTGTNYVLTTDRSGSTGPSATYVVLSHGINGKGAYPLIGTAVGTACGSDWYNDVANCDDTDANFYDTEYNTNTNTTAYFDDYIVWGSNALERSPSVSPDASSSGTCLSSGGTACEYAINTAGSTPDCDVTCANAGYSASGAQVTNCTYSASCAQGDNLSCDYQCCCSGTPPAGCSAVSGYTWNTNCTGDVPVIAHAGSTTVTNSAAGYTGSITASCSNGTITYSGASCTAISATSSTSSTSSSTGGQSGCSSGNCEEWCAPCRNNRGQIRYGGRLCERFIVSTNPCQAACVYAGCGWGWRGGYGCYHCP